MLRATKTMPDIFWIALAVLVAAYVLWDTRNAKHLEEALDQLLEAQCEICELRQKLKEYEEKDKANSPANNCLP